jgi:hypothetical protein
VTCGKGPVALGISTAVLTVVNRLFDMTQPDMAVFGEKDWQQLALIRSMAAERHPNIRVVGVPTVRDDDGLAMSSRNRYLSAAERETAALIPVALNDIVAEAGSAESVARARQKLEQSGVDVDYLAEVDPVTLEPRHNRTPQHESSSRLESDRPGSSTTCQSADCTRTVTLRYQKGRHDDETELSADEIIEQKAVRLAKRATLLAERARRTPCRFPSRHHRCRPSRSPGPRR